MLAALGLLLAACAAPDEDAEVLRVGLLNPVTGPFAGLGEDVNDGVRMFVDDRGGEVAGLEVELFVEDEANDEAQATEAAQQLVERDRVDAIVGFVNSGVAYAAAEYLAGTDVPTIISVAGADDLTQRDARDNLFRVSYTSSQDALPMGTLACEELGYDTAAVIGLDYSFGWEAVGGFATAYEDAGCEVVQETYVELDTADWGPEVRALDRDVDVVWALNAGPDAIRFLEAYRDFDVDVPLIGHGSMTDEEVLVEQAGDAEGVVTTLHYSREIDTPENEAFVEAFEATYDRTVSRYAEGGWTAMLMLEQAVEQAGTTEPAALVGALADARVDAPRGPVHFDERGQAVYNIYVREVTEVDGRFVNEVVDVIDEVSQFWTYDPDEWLDRPRLGELAGTWDE